MRNVHPLARLVVMAACFISFTFSFEYSSFCNKMCLHGRGGNLCKCNAVHFVGKRGIWGDESALGLPMGARPLGTYDHEGVKRRDVPRKGSCGSVAHRSTTCRRMLDKKQWTSLTDRSAKSTTKVLTGTGVHRRKSPKNALDASSRVSRKPTLNFFTRKVQRKRDKEWSHTEIGNVKLINCKS